MTQHPQRDPPRRTTPRARFDYAAFVTEWRRLADAHGLAARTGQPLEHAGKPWWADAALWNDPGKSRSSTEATALAHIAAESRRVQGSERPKSNTELFWEVFTEGAGERRAATIARREELLAARHRRHEESLREKYAGRGETVEEVEGVRMVVKMKRKAA